LSIDEKQAIFVSLDWGSFWRTGLVESPSTDKNNGMHGINAATAIFAQYEQFIRAVICSKIGHQAYEYEEDIFQDFFLSLAHKPPPDDVKNIKSYLYRAITHDIMDAIHRMNIYRARLEKYSEQPENSINITKSQIAFIYDEDIDRVFKLIEKRLLCSQSRAIILRYKYGYEIKEIAKEMCIDSKSVSRYISVGLKKIRQFFSRKTR